MTAQMLAATLVAYRIGDNRGAYPIFSAEGSRIAPGRWNTALCPMVYLSEHYSTAMLEKLVYANGIMPPNAHFITVTIPAGVSYETFSPAHHPDWASEDRIASRAYGAAWHAGRRSLLLVVPSVVARMERNVLVNPEHPEFSRIAVDPISTPVWWDNRLFAPPP